MSCSLVCVLGGSSLCVFDRVVLSLYPCMCFCFCGCFLSFVFFVCVF